MTYTLVNRTYEGTVKDSAQAVVPHLVELLEPRTVLDVGCGRGEWALAFYPHVQHVYGVDIAASGPWRTHDLNEPLYLAKTFDLVLCLEVAEHLPESAADTLVDTLCRHGDDIVFSAATPGQEGKGHINCQPHEYWHAKFDRRGYLACDWIRPRIKYDKRVSPWYRNNMFHYFRADS